MATKLKQHPVHHHHKKRFERKKVTLKRNLGLFEATLSGVGIILGAGIYALIGEAAGIAGIKSKKTGLLNSIASYENDIEKVNAVLNEVNKQINPLKKQMKNAERYKILKKELNENELFIIMKS